MNQIWTNPSALRSQVITTGIKSSLIEKNALLGGLATIGLISWYEPLCNGSGTQLMFSQTEELLNLAIKYGYHTLDENWLNNHTGKGRFSTNFNPNLFSLSLNQLLLSTGVDILYETLVSDVIVKEDKIVSVEVCSVSGKEIIECDESKLTEFPSIARSLDTAYVDKVANHNGRLILLLNQDRLLLADEAEAISQLVSNV